MNDYFEKEKKCNGNRVELLTIVHVYKCLYLEGNHDLMNDYFKKIKKVQGFTLIDKGIYISCTYAMTQNDDSTFVCEEKFLA